MAQEMKDKEKIKHTRTQASKERGAQGKEEQIRKEGPNEGNKEKGIEGKERNKDICRKGSKMVMKETQKGG